MNTMHVANVYPSVRIRKTRSSGLPTKGTQAHAKVAELLRERYGSRFADDVYCVSVLCSVLQNRRDYVDCMEILDVTNEADS